MSSNIFDNIISKRSTTADISKFMKPGVYENLENQGFFMA